MRYLIIHMNGHESWFELVDAENADKALEEHVHNLDYASFVLNEDDTKKLAVFLV